MNLPTVLVIAPQLEWVKNWAREQKLPFDRLLYVTKEETLLAMPRKTPFVWLGSSGHIRRDELFQQVIRQRDHQELPANINEWPLTMFIPGGDPWG